MKFALNITCENAAFHGEDCDDEEGCGLAGGVCQSDCAREVRRILNNVAQHMDDHDGTGGGSIFIRDHNGNTVGEASYDEMP